MELSAQEISTNMHKASHRWTQEAQRKEEKRPMKQQISIALLLLVLFSVFSACSANANSYQVDSHSSCQSATGQDTTCTVTLTSASSSTGDFNWTASSSPLGAQFNPPSGSVSPGASSDVIKVTISPDICPFTLIFADSGGFSVTNEMSNC